jgi:hypothetical protein
MRAESALAKKLLLKEKMQACFINTPAGFWHDFGTLPKGVALQSGGLDTCDWGLVFAKTDKELLEHGPRVINAVKADGILWVAYPKKTSGEQTTLTRNYGWELLKEAGGEMVGTAAIDDVWTSVRWKLG